MKELPTYKHGFKMPEGYLDSFESKLQEKLTQELKNDLMNPSMIAIVNEGVKDKKVFTVRKLLYTGVAVAACLAIYVAVMNTETPASIDDIAMTTLEDYLFENTTTFSLDEIASQFPEETITTIEDDALISDEQLEAYLIDNLNNNTLILE